VIFRLDRFYENGGCADAKMVIFCLLRGCEKAVGCDLFLENIFVLRGKAAKDG
jgi:hypothetical protein